MDVKNSKIKSISSIDRSGIDKVLEFLEESTFYSDPASCLDFNSYEGGLAEHSHNVFEILERNSQLHPDLAKFKDSIKIVGLLHDVCKIGTFQKVFKNTPVKGPDGKNKLKENGRILFMEKESYDYNDGNQLPYPNGVMSTTILKQYLKLNKLEDLAIHWHQGIFDQPAHRLGLLYKAQKTHKIIFMLYAAKQEAMLYHSIKKEK